jgi:hypothetical protein
VAAANAKFVSLIFPLSQDRTVVKLEERGSASFIVAANEIFHDVAYRFIVLFLS